MKVVENSRQNAQNCTTFKKILWGACPQTPLATARSFAVCDMYTQNPHNFKVCSPLLRNPAYAPTLDVFFQILASLSELRMVTTCIKSI